MAFRSWPHDIEPDGTTPQEVTEDDFRHSLAAFAPDGVMPDSGIGGTPALRVDALADSSGVTITSGYCQVNGYTGHNDAVETLAAPANDASQARMYLVVMRLDRSERTITPAVLVGSASSNPQLPSLTRDDNIWELPIAQFRRAGSGGGITNLVDRRMFINPGGVLNTRSDARPTGGVLPGSLVYETDTSRLSLFRGGQWNPVWDANLPGPWTGLSLRGGFGHPGHGYHPSWRWEPGGVVRLRGRIGRLNGNPIGHQQFVARLPAATFPSGIVGFAVPSQRGANGVTSRIEISSLSADVPGRIFVWIPGSGNYNPSWVSLDGCTYVP